MSSFAELLEEIVSPDRQAPIEKKPDFDNSFIAEPFDIALFANEIKEHSESKNRDYYELQQSISAYSIAHDCILNVVKKIQGHQVKSFADTWLPIFMRSVIGTAIHDAIQSHTKQFTEIERSLKVPSIRFSGRMDAIIGNSILVEIKSCPYTDYKKIIKTNKPREEDFIQLLTYKYIIENYLKEAQSQPLKSEEFPNGTRTPPPSLEKYNIEKLQFIYIAHDLVASDMENISEAMKMIQILKKELDSKDNKFFFIKQLVIRTDTIDPMWLKWIENKIKRINWYVDNNKLPGIDDPYIDTKGCYFCRYSLGCEMRERK